MKIIYAQETFVPESPCLFLAGPSPRKYEVKSWRPKALELLKKLKFSGQVLVPESADGKFYGTYHGQVEWEYFGLENCDKICLWMPRDIDILPGFVSNVEFGRYVGSGRLVYGRPKDAPHTQYLDWLYRKLTCRYPHDDLENLLCACIF